jgi:hypothetical protein
VQVTHHAVMQGRAAVSNATPVGPDQVQAEAQPQPTPEQIMAMINHLIVSRRS